MSIIPVSSKMVQKIMMMIMTTNDAYFGETHLSLAGPNFIKLLKQQIELKIFLLSKNLQDTSYNWYMLDGILTVTLILVSIIVLC